jgi:hypothetical protein
MICFMNKIPQPAPPIDREETMMERHQRVLRRLTDLEMQLAEAAQEKALAEADRPGSPFYASGARRIPEPEPPPRPSGRDPPKRKSG